MKICVAQLRSIKGDVLANSETHKKFIEYAISHMADAIFFSELSLTGYEPGLAKNLATVQDDKLFEDFQEISNQNNITIGLGVPIKSTSGIHISMIIFQADNTRKVYSKQQLHVDELPYFVGGQGQLMVTVSNKKIAPAICYETLQDSHSENAYKLGAEIYVASVAKSQSGIDKTMMHYSAVAKKFSIPVLMSNCVGYCDNFKSAGQSSIWTKHGVLLEQLDNNSEGLLMFDTETEEVIKLIV